MLSSVRPSMLLASPPRKPLSHTERPRKIEVTHPWQQVDRHCRRAFGPFGLAKRRRLRYRAYSRHVVFTRVTFDRRGVTTAPSEDGVRKKGFASARSWHVDYMRASKRMQALSALAVHVHYTATTPAYRRPRYALAKDSKTHHVRPKLSFGCLARREGARK